MLSLFQLNLPLLTGTVAATTSTTAADNNMSVSDAVDGVVNISEAIANHGITLVICAFFLLFSLFMLFMFIKLTNKMINTFIKRMESEKSQNDEIINKVLEKFLEEDSKKKAEEEAEAKEHKDLVGLHTKHVTIFKAETQKVINKLRCNRVAVYVFHNGNRACFGFPFIKISCVFEDTLTGMMTLRGRTHLNMPLHLFNDMVKNLYDNTDFAGNLDEVEIQDSSIKEFLDGSDSKSIFIRGIRNIDDKLAGFTVCEFEKNMNYHDQEVYNNIKFALQEMNAAIRHFITDEKEHIQKENKTEE